MTREELTQKFFAAAKEKFGEKIVSTYINYDIPTVELQPDIHRSFASWLKSDPEWEFGHFIDITSIDYMKTREKRFAIIVHVRSHKLNFKICFRTSVGEEAPHIDSLYPVYLGALWSEREVYDLMGIIFKDHPRMTRILNPDNFEGHPLRKDFPVKGMHRGSFPRGTVISNKRREPVMTKETRPQPLDTLMPRTPIEKRRSPIREEAEKNA